MEADGVWWLPRSSKPSAAETAAAGSIPASSDTMNHELLKDIPQVEKLMSESAVQQWIPRIGRPLVLQEVRKVLERVRSDVLGQGKPPILDSILSAAEAACRQLFSQRTAAVVNCTGVVIHTNLGRSPIEQECWDAASRINCGYCSLEFDPAAGKRGERSSFFSRLFCGLTGAEAALAVNNNAAALLLVLCEFAAGKEVVISRGELVQIGGGFRIPEILEQSGARLVEVGTTNITTADDYLKSITEQTAMVLKVHRSNFALRGFASSPSVSELARSLPEGVLLVYDQGSGALGADAAGETGISSLLNQGADLVTCSGDKILGSVQAGIIAGRCEPVRRTARHPLYRALRPGKTVLSLLEEALIRRLNGHSGVPLDAYRQSRDEMMRKVRKIIRGYDRRYVSAADAPMTLGGGSSPDEVLPGAAVELRLGGCEQDVMAFLRTLDVPIIAAVSGGAVRLHMAAVSSEYVPYIREAVGKVLDRFVCT